MLLSPQLPLHGTRMMPYQRLHLFETSSPFMSTLHFDDYFASGIGPGFHSRLEPHLESSHITPESGLSGEVSIGIQADTSPGFGSSEWNAYVASMSPGANERP
ncbi:hypothetical protein EDD18DRAFT_1332007 [Armillaria luteobubalina]|uniref:Uncharacterized protein n=1 Tax=Armillaria luteobubalina TaxID=153913 RepID=A0AA39Q5F4_9AGAR|nr:hypothetical protein EDD18DRAFT_1332007 [Armillaria luteobubalina]